jgi:gliding motility-associated-like protein
LRTAFVEARKSPDNTIINRFEFSQPNITVAMHYDVLNGQVVVSNAPAASGLAAAGGMPAATANQTLGIYWNNGDKFVKLFGKVDSLQQVVQVQGINGGEYQIRGVLRDQGINFDVSQLSNKVITPNGDGRNDKAVFMLDNPHDAGFSGRIFDKNGAFIADMTRGILANTLQWDATSRGRVVPGGVYVYQITGENKVFSGTLIVIR